MPSWLMTEEEVAAKNKEVKELYESGDMEDTICALLMDIKVGNTGFHSGIARTKAAAIMELLETGKLKILASSSV